MKKYIILFCFLFVGCVSFALDYDVYKLSNGQTVILKPVNTNPIVTIDTWIKTGSINEDDSNNGVAHFLEHLFFKGSVNHKAGEFDKILESKGAITNAATSKDFTHYYITIPSNYFNLALNLHADMFLNPAINLEELEKERPVVIEEIAKDLNSPQSILYDDLISLMYKTHPYKRKVIGTKEIIANISKEEIFKFYNRYYNPSNMITVIAGDINSKEVLEQVKKNFNKKAKHRHNPVYKQEAKITTAQRKVDYYEGEVGYMLVGFHGAKPEQKDDYALDVLTTILGEGKSSILNKKIKEESQLAFYVASSNSSYRDGSMVSISVHFTPSNLNLLEKEIFDCIKEIQNNGVTQKELDLAKSIIVNDTYFGLESVSNITSQIGYSTVLTSNPNYAKNYLANIQKVTIEDIQRVAKKYLSQNQSATVILLPEALKNKSEVFAKVEESTSCSAKILKEIKGTKKYQLANDATLLYTDNKSNEIVAISIQVRGGKLTENIAGVSSLTASAMLKGTKKYSNKEFQEILEENGIELGVGADSDYFTVTMLCTKPKLDLAISLLNEVVNNATFNSEEIEKIKTDVVNNYKRNLDVPSKYVFNKYGTLIYENSPYSVTSEVLVRNLPKITRDSILQYYNSVFDSKNIVISVNGNVDEQYLIKKFTSMFKKGLRQVNYNDYSSKIASLKTSKIHIKQVKDLKSSWVVLGWQTCGVLNKKESATLQIIDTILGSGMSSRLFINLREKSGLAYAVGSSYSPNLLKGSLLLYICTNPKNVDIAKQKMIAELNTLKIQPVSEQELQEAKERLFGNFVIGLETNLSKATTVARFEVSGRGFDYFDEYKELLNSVTAKDVMAVANKYFNSVYVTSIVDNKK